MNQKIKEAFKNFTVDGKKIPVAFLYYNGHETTYITYQIIGEDNSYSSDDDLRGYVVYYDFDIYSKGDYTNIIKAVKDILKTLDFTYQPSRSSGDMYEQETGYYHRTLNFAIPREEN